MTPDTSQAFGVEIRNLRSLISARYETADDAGASALEFASTYVERAQAALDASDQGRTWLQLTGAIDFIDAAGMESDELARIRSAVDRLLEAA